MCYNIIYARKYRPAPYDVLRFINRKTAHRIVARRVHGRQNETKRVGFKGASLLSANCRLSKKYVQQNTKMK